MNELPETADEAIVTLDQIRYTMEVAAVQVKVAMLLSFSMLIAVLMVTAFTLKWRKTGLVLAVLWGLITATIPSGISLVMGPLAAFIAMCGLVYCFTDGDKRSVRRD